MSADELAPRDEALLRRLRHVLDVVDPVPDDLVEQGRALFRLHRPGVDLMELVELDAATSAVRSAASVSRMHFFELGTATVDVEVTTRDAFCRVVGVVADASGTRVDTVTLETTASTFTTAVDDEGRFELARVPAGPVRLTFEGGGRERPLATPWFDAV